MFSCVFLHWVHRLSCFLLQPTLSKHLCLLLQKAKKGSANDKINIGFIGLGQQAINLMNGFITIPEVRIVAGCDIYDIKRDRFEQRVNKYYADNKIKNKFTMYVRYEEMLARPDIDAVIVQKFMNDVEANSKLHYEYRKPYSLD